MEYDYLGNMNVVEILRSNEFVRISCVRIAVDSIFFFKRVAIVSPPLAREGGSSHSVNRNARRPPRDLI